MGLGTTSLIIDLNPQLCILYQGESTAVTLIQYTVMRSLRFMLEIAREARFRQCYWFYHIVHATLGHCLEIHVTCNVRAIVI